MYTGDDEGYIDTDNIKKYPLWYCKDKKIYMKLQTLEERWTFDYWFDENKKVIYPIQDGYPPMEEYLSEEEYEDLLTQTQENEDIDFW